MPEKSLQDSYAPDSTCFGCGPANREGLRIKSFARGDQVVAEWTAKPHYEAWPGTLNGGIIGTLLDCHSNWTAAWHLIQRDNLDHVPSTVTAKYEVKLHRPTRTDGPIELVAHVDESHGDRVVVESELQANGEVCATFKGTFVAVRPGHPAYRRW